jgi:putative hydroxymethylpyrimidine transport system ATP-binding protein
MSKMALELIDVSFHYQGDKKKRENITIFDKLNLQVKQGEFISILGPSGSGKSTLFRLLTGLEEVVEGRILLDGNEVRNRLGHIGYMPQQDLLLPWRTILQNAVLPLELKAVERKSAHQRVIRLLQEFGLAGYEQRYPHELSGGMRQRVSFLRAILGGADLLLLDEPFSALDSMTRLMMQEWLLEQWTKWKKTIVFITHDVEEALFLSDRILVFTEKPIHSIQELSVPLDRPRELADLGAASITQMKQELLEHFRARVKL